MQEDNLFATEDDIISFLNSPRARGDFGIESLLTFPYVTDQTKALACAYITRYLENRLASQTPLEPLGREIQIIAPFLEAAGYTPAIEPLTTLRNKLEARDDYRVPTASGKYASTVAVRNAIATLQLGQKAPTEVSSSHTTSSHQDSLSGTIEWYLERSQRNGLSPRCPFATVVSCPRFYQSLSLLGEAGSTKISAKHDKKLLKKWKKSPLWPVTDEQATSISGPNDGNKHFSKFCPEVSYERFGYFASGLYSYADEIDRENTHQKLFRLKVHQNDSRWYWANIEALHYSECPYYSLLHNSNGVTEKAGEDIVEIKPNIWGIGLNLNAVFRKLNEWIKR